MTMSNKCATHVLDKDKSESCLVKAPANHASESVLVVSELLCTSVQANTERGTQTKEYAGKCAHVGKQTTLLSTSIWRVVRHQNSNRARTGELSNNPGSESESP